MKLNVRIALSIFFVLAATAHQEVIAQRDRMTIDFNNDWIFSRQNDSTLYAVNADTTGWERVDLPHDWSISSDFSKQYPSTNQGGALPGGTGWYRKTFAVPGGINDRKLRICFDGVYRNSEVWVNGQFLGKRAGGYTPFEYDITKYLYDAPAKNVIAVRVDNSRQPDSRWYSGSGIYRDVRMVITRPIAFRETETFIHTTAIEGGQAMIAVETEIENYNAGSDLLIATCDVFSPSGKKVATLSADRGVNGKGNSILRFSGVVRDPLLWSIDHPNLYKIVFRAYLSAVLMDQWQTTFGIRNFRFDAGQGFFLNGRHVKIKGVCMHHDLGALGAAFNKAAARRQLKLLKEMGCNAIRTAHNSPAAGFLDLCDEMGFLVMDEAFDMWQKGKNRFDYHLDFRADGIRDIQAMVKRDRNHPSVIMWSIGNEIREQFDSTGMSLAKELAGAVRALDSTRPVTCALTENFPEKNYIYQSRALDVLGFNYKLFDYDKLPARFPGEKFIATETASALASRGSYDLPSDSVRIWPPDAKQPFMKGNADMTVSAYDHAYAYWGATHEEAWLAVKKRDFISGCFVWSGFDFLGEPVPYPWPARSAYYGIIDLAGLPKDVYYMYQSEWTDRPVLHLFPHWNWKEGQVVDVWAYYNNADEVELYLNGKSLGVQKKTAERLHVQWKVPFRPGTLRAIARTGGRVVMAREVRTAGKAARIELVADRRVLHADGSDLSFVTVRVVDKEGNTVPYAENLIRFSVSGAGRLEGTDNGFQADSVSLKSPLRHASKGMAIAIVRAARKKGNITLRADSTGLLPAVLSLKTSD